MNPRLHSYRCAFCAVFWSTCAAACRIAAAVPIALVAIVAFARAEPLGHAVVPILQAAPAAAASGPMEQSKGAGERYSVDTIDEALEDCANELPSKERWSIAQIIHEESEEYGFDALFITALVQVESGCKTTARGGGAHGLTQLLPATARGVARRAGLEWHGERSLSEPAVNIKLGLHYLGELQGQLGDPYRAVAAYNMGPARVRRMSSARAQRTRYVRKILRRYEALREQFA